MAPLDPSVDLSPYFTPEITVCCLAYDILRSSPHLIEQHTSYALYTFESSPSTRFSASPLKCSSH